MKSILILGGARCVWEDVASLGQWPAQVDVAAVNDVGAKWPGHLKFWASLHPRKFKNWEKQRKLNGHQDGYLKYSHKFGRPMVDYVIPDWGGSSGLYAVKIALMLEYTQIVLAGIPMDSKEAHFFNEKEWSDCKKYCEGWEKHFDDIKEFTRSCSGWTKNLLGPPKL